MVFILGMMVFWCNGDNYAAAPLIVEIAKDLHLDISQAALSVTAYMLPFGLFTLLFGPLADRYGKTRIINLAAFGTAVFSSLGAVAWDLKSLSIHPGCERGLCRRYHSSDHVSRRRALWS